MAAEFRSLAEILRAEQEPAPAISPLIAEPALAPVCDREHRDGRLQRAHLEERQAAALERLLTEIAAEVLGRELLLAPANVEEIVSRLVHRYGFEAGFDVVARNGDVTIASRDGKRAVDASLGRRLRAAIDRALG